MKLCFPVAVAFALAALALFGADRFASPQKTLVIRLPPTEDLMAVEREVRSWADEKALSSDSEQWDLRYSMIRALVPLREHTPFTEVRFVDSEVVEKYADSSWILPRHSVVCGTVRLRDDFLREVPNAIETNGLVRIENAQGKVGLDEYWYVAFSPDGRWAALGESPEMARLALEEKPDETIRGMRKRGQVCASGLKLMEGSDRIFKGVSKLSRFDFELWLEADGLHACGKGILASAVEDPPSASLGRLLYILATDELVSALEESGDDYSSMRAALLALIGQLPESGSEVPWRVERRGENLEVEVKITAAEFREFLFLGRTWDAKKAQKAAYRAMRERMINGEIPVRAAERLVSQGKLADAVAALERARTNDWQSCYQVGDFYGTHFMLPTQRAERVQYWMEHAYQLADERGKRQVAGQCAMGFYFKKYQCHDEGLARLWLQRAADAGSAYWQCVLANALVFGSHGFPQDGEKALHYLEEAEKVKHLKTHHVRATMYELGIGLPQDYAKALECRELGIERGSDLCRRDLAIMLLRGHCGEGRRAEGFDMLKRLVAQGIEGASNCLSHLGYACETGRGTKKDLPQAIEYYRQAAKLGDQYSIEKLKKLQAK